MPYGTGINEDQNKNCIITKNSKNQRGKCKYEFWKVPNIISIVMAILWARRNR